MIKLILVIGGVALSALFFFMMVIGVSVAIWGCAICDDSPPNYLGAALVFLIWAGLQYLIGRVIWLGWSGAGYRGF